MTTLSTGQGQITTPIKLPHFVADQRGRYRARIALTEEQIIKAAVLLLNKRVERGLPLTGPEITRAYLKAQLRGLEYEVFACLFLDNQHRAIAFEELFRGTIDESAVYPREVVKRALQINAAVIIFAHNHPSGVNEPSPADRHITDKLKKSLSMIDIRVLDHFIIGDGEPYSFAEHGLL